MAATLNRGAVKIGCASSSVTADQAIRPWEAAYTTATASVMTTAKRAASRRLSRYTSSIRSTSGSAVWAATNACRPNRASTPASSAVAISIGMRFITRSNQPVMPASVMSTALAMKAPTACAMSKPPPPPAPAPPPAPRPPPHPPTHPSHHDGLAQYQRRHQRAQSRAQAQRPHPGTDLSRRGTKRLRGLEHDGHRTGKAHQHRNEPGDGGREAQVFEKLHGPILASCLLERSAQGASPGRALQHNDAMHPSLSAPAAAPDAASSGASSATALPDFRCRPRAFLRALFDAAVRSAQPLHGMRAWLPPQ